MNRKIDRFVGIENERDKLVREDAAQQGLANKASEEDLVLAKVLEVALLGLVLAEQALSDARVLRDVEHFVAIGHSA